MNELYRYDRGGIHRVLASAQENVEREIQSKGEIYSGIPS